MWFGRWSVPRHGRRVGWVNERQSDMNTPHLNLARFDFVSVRLAVVCARVGNLTEAARECHLVLPAASRRLRDLERALGAPLFERHPRGLKPTALGRAFTKRGVATWARCTHPSTACWPRPM